MPRKRHARLLEHRFRAARPIRRRNDPRTMLATRDRLLPRRLPRTSVIMDIPVGGAGGSRTLAWRFCRPPRCRFATAPNPLLLAWLGRGRCFVMAANLHERASLGFVVLSAGGAGHVEAVPLQKVRRTSGARCVVRDGDDHPFLRESTAGASPDRRPGRSDTRGSRRSTRSRRARRTSITSTLDGCASRASISARLRTFAFDASVSPPAVPVAAPALGGRTQLSRAQPTSSSNLLPSLDLLLIDKPACSRYCPTGTG